MLLDVDPVMIRLGPLAIRWYGFFMAVSIGVGLYYLVREGLRAGFDEDFLYLAGLSAVVVGVIGARVGYVVTNWPFYASRLAEIPRLDHGGLSIHGAVVGGAVGLYGFLLRRRRAGAFRRLADLTVPGIAVGIMLVRIGNIFNQEVLGRETVLWAFGRHPAQVYGSLLGVVLLILHNVVARRRPAPPPGYLFWNFVLYYSLLRGLVEETFRDNPLYAVGYVDPALGAGFFTLTQLITVPLVLLAWWARGQTARRAAGPAAMGRSGR